jgi:hypothetical protein
MADDLAGQLPLLVFRTGAPQAREGLRPGSGRSAEAEVAARVLWMARPAVAPELGA